MKKGKKIAAGTLALTLFGGACVYAGTVIDRYKTPRGNIATVETENVHKNRIGITVNGEAVTSNTIYFNNTTYAPIREVATMLNASVNYNSRTMSADIFTETNLLDLFGITLHTEYLIATSSYTSSTFKMTLFNPTTNQFEGLIGKKGITGYLTESEMVYEFVGDSSSPAVELKFDFSNHHFMNDDVVLIIK